MVVVNISTQNEVKVLSHMIINYAISIFHYFYKAIYQKKKHVDADTYRIFRTTSRTWI